MNDQHDPSSGLLYLSRADVVAAARTAAVSVVAARHLAQAGFRSLTSIGCGPSGTQHVFTLESDDEVILVNPMGMAVIDVACAKAIYYRARQAKIGTWLSR